MKHLYPTYYERFRCIAAACPDSCCQGWDVVIDSDTEAFYNNVQGALGEKLRAAIYTDADGDRVFHLAAQKKCPFWGDDKLCDIYRALGEEHLCATCAQFPRITMDYTTFTEHTLALACPEAARLILNIENAYADFTDTDFETCEDYSEEIMRLLLDARAHAAGVLTAEKPLSERLAELQCYAEEVQKDLTGFVPASAGIAGEAYGELEYIDEKNRIRITKAASREPDFSQYEKELTHLALYWLYRYWLGAIDSYDVVTPVRFLISSVGIVANLAKESGDITAAAQIYSKEIEQSYGNMERLWDSFGV